MSINVLRQGINCLIASESFRTDYRDIFGARKVQEQQFPHQQMLFIISSGLQVSTLEGME